MEWGLKALAEWGNSRANRLTSEDLPVNPSEKPYMNNPGVQDFLKMFDKFEERLNEQIQQGLEKDTASTGISMDKLKGAAHAQAEASNIGGGSKETGGGGTAEGYDIIAAKKSLEFGKSAFILGVTICDKIRDEENRQKMLEHSNYIEGDKVTNDTPLIPMEDNQNCEYDDNEEFDDWECEDDDDAEFDDWDYE